MVLLVPEECDDVVSLHQASPPPIRRHDYVEGALYFSRGGAQPETHARVPVCVKVTFERLLVSVRWGDGDLPVSPDCVQCCAVESVAKAFNAVLHSGEGINVRDRRGIEVQAVDAIRIVPFFFGAGKTGFTVRSVPVI